MYNKNLFKKVNDKKILHKVGKHWVAISVALLAMIGGGAATGATVTHASIQVTSAPHVVTHGEKKDGANVETKPTSFNAEAQYNGQAISGASSVSVSLASASTNNAVKNSSNQSISAISKGASASTTNVLSTSDVTYTSASIDGDVNVDASGNVTAASGNNQPMISYSSAFLTAQGAAKTSLTVSGSDVTLNSNLANTGDYSLGTASNLVSDLVAPSGYTLISSSVSNGAQVTLNRSGVLSNSGYAFVLTNNASENANSSAESAAKSASYAASVAYGNITDNSSDLNTDEGLVLYDYTNASKSVSDASSAVVVHDSSDANTKGNNALANISSANLDGSKVSFDVNLLNSNAVVLSDNVSILNSLVQNYGNLSSGVDENGDAISSVANHYSASSSAEEPTIQQASSNASSAMNSVASANALSSSANLAISAATKNNPGLSYSNKVTSASNDVSNQSFIAASNSTVASEQSQSAGSTLSDVSTAVSDENSYAKASNSTSAASESVVASKAVASADANAQSASNAYVNASKAANIASNDVNNISKIASLATQSGYSGSIFDTSNDDTFYSNAKSNAADANVAASSAQVSALATSDTASNADKLNSTVPAKPGSVATNSDVSSAARNDPKLASAVSAFNGDKDPANGNSLINALKNDAALKNQNLDNVINDIEKSENSSNNHGNLGNLLKLYNLYTELVKSGLFNN